MSLRIAYRDYLTYLPSVVFSANSEVQSADRVKTNHLSDKWITSAGTSAHIQFYLGQPASIRCVVLADHNLAFSSSGASASVWTDTTSTFSTESKLGTIPAITGNSVLPYYFTATTAAYVRLKFHDGTDDGDFRFGKISVGTYYDFSSCVVNSLSVNPVDPSTMQETEGGQLHYDHRPVYNSIVLGLGYIDKTERVMLQSICQGQGRPITVTPFSEEYATSDDTTIYGTVEFVGQLSQKGPTFVGPSLQIRQWVE